MTITVTGRKNARSSGYRVWLDGFQDDTPWAPYTNEILMVRLDGSETRRLAHHRSRPFNTYNYQPRASASRDGTRLLFAANYGFPPNAYTSYVDAYIMAVDLQAMNASAGQTVTPRPGEAGMPELLETVLSPAERLLRNQYLYPKRVPGPRWDRR
jgi:hypothetical protein